MTIANKPRTRNPVAPLLPALFLAASLLFPSPARAADCLLDYVGCVEDASDLDSFFGRSFAGLGCYVDLISCLQRRLA
jgi:hypothetical protein